MPAGKPLGLALIGAGGISYSWAPAIAKTGGAALLMAADTNLRKAQDLAGNFKNCIPVADWKTVLKNKNVDAVIIAVPHKFLAQISKAALKAGKHVLCEKPGAISPTEMRSVILAAKNKKRVYMAGFNHRFHPAFMMARKVVDAGEIGKLQFIRARYGFGGRPGYEKEWRFNKEMSGGGELIDQGVHMIDMARSFLGDFRDVKGFAPKLYWKNGVEDNGFALLRTAAGQVASIHVSWTNWKWVHSFEIYGTDGYLLIDGLDQRYQGPERLTIGRRDPEFKAPPAEKVLVFESEGKEDSFARELNEFISAIKEKREAQPNGEAAFEALKIVKRIYAQK